LQADSERASNSAQTNLSFDIRMLLNQYG
jgi:hypothetical protein